jgi:transposase
MKPLYRRIAGLDVHRMLYVLTVLIELDDGTVTKHQRSFGGFQRDLRDLVAWLLELGVKLVVMESTGSDFQSVYAALEKAGIPAHVVNARHVKNVPGRKTDISDSEWLAQLGRFGLVRPSFIPPKELRELRLVSRYRQKLAQTLAGEKNRLHKLLDDAGIKLGAVVSDSDGVSARAMIEGLIEGKPIAQLPELAKGALRTKRDTLEQALGGGTFAPPSAGTATDSRSYPLPRNRNGEPGYLPDRRHGSLCRLLATLANPARHRSNLRRHDPSGNRH